MSRIIIIESNNYLKIKLEKLLKKNNFLDIETIDPKRLTDSYLNFIKKDIGLFIVDLDNHNHDVIALIRKINSITHNDGISIIALSSNGDVAILKKAIKAGCKDFILKPFDNESLIYKVKKLFDITQSNDNSPNKYKPVKSKTDAEIRLIWNEAYAIDVSEIDGEHKDLFNKYEELYHLMKAGKGHEFYEELLSFLNDYVHIHFNHEQLIHKDEAYPNRTEHFTIHEEFKASLKKIFEEGHSSNVSDVELIRISLFLKNWLIHHILVEDVKFGNYMREKRKQTIEEPRMK